MPNFNDLPEMIEIENEDPTFKEEPKTSAEYEEEEDTLSVDDCDIIGVDPELYSGKTLSQIIPGLSENVVYGMLTEMASIMGGSLKDVSLDAEIENIIFNYNQDSSIELSYSDTDKIKILTYIITLLNDYDDGLSDVTLGLTKLLRDNGRIVDKYVTPSVAENCINELVRVYAPKKINTSSDVISLNLCDLIADYFNIRNKSIWNSEVVNMNGGYANLEKNILNYYDNYM